MPLARLNEVEPGDPVQTQASDRSPPGHWPVLRHGISNRSSLIHRFAAHGTCLSFPWLPQALRGCPSWPVLDSSPLPAGFSVGAGQIVRSRSSQSCPCRACHTDFFVQRRDALGHDERLSNEVCGLCEKVRDMTHITFIGLVNVGGRNARGNLLRESDKRQLHSRRDGNKHHVCCSRKVSSSWAG